DHLWRPVSERHEPLRGSGFMNPGSYLAYAIAARFVSSVVYIYPPNGRCDIPEFYFRGNDPASGFIQLKAFSPEAMSTLAIWKADRRDCFHGRASGAIQPYADPAIHGRRTVSGWLSLPVAGVYPEEIGRAHFSDQ